MSTDNFNNDLIKCVVGATVLGVSFYKLSNMPDNESHKFYDDNSSKIGQICRALVKFFSSERVIASAITCTGMYFYITRIFVPVLKNYTK